MRTRALAVAITALALVASGTASASAPQVTDVEDDAYGGSLGVPNPLLSQPAFDITAVEWARSGRRDFSVTMTVKGTPTTGVNYFPAALVGDTYEVWFILRVGSTARYNVFERDPVTGAQGALVSSRYGSAVQVGPSTVRATFSAHHSKLAPELRDHMEIGPFAGVTCEWSDDCTAGRSVDLASSAADARFSLG